jgi:hypothetical protein
MIEAEWEISTGAALAAFHAVGCKHTCREEKARST